MVTYKRYKNKEYNERIEFLLLNYDYIDGNEYIAQLFVELFGFKTDTILDGIWYKVIQISRNNCKYVMEWHEEVGNCIYCLEQSMGNNILLEGRLSRILEIINAKKLSQ